MVVGYSGNALATDCAPSMLDLVDKPTKISRPVKYAAQPWQNYFITVLERHWHWVIGYGQYLPVLCDIFTGCDAQYPSDSTAVGAVHRINISRCVVW